MVKKIVVLVIVIIIILVGIIINWSSLYKNDIYDVSKISENIMINENDTNEVKISNVIEQEETESKKNNSHKEVNNDIIDTSEITNSYIKNKTNEEKSENNKSEDTKTNKENTTIKEETKKDEVEKPTNQTQVNKVDQESEEKEQNKETVEEIVIQKDVYNATESNRLKNTIDKYAKENSDLWGKSGEKLYSVEISKEAMESDVFYPFNEFNVEAKVANVFSCTFIIYAVDSGNVTKYYIGIKEF